MRNFRQRALVYYSPHLSIATTHPLPSIFPQPQHKLPDASAGCPHQVRNLKSCTKVAVDFVSPENIHECLHLTEEFQRLPRNHRAREDKLEIKKMTIYGVDQAVKDLEDLVNPS